MSRGHGRVEREILTILEATRGSMTPLELAARIYQDPTHRPDAVKVRHNQLLSVRRALLKLREEGQVFELPQDVVGQSRHSREKSSTQWVTRAAALDYVEWVRKTNAFDLSQFPDLLALSKKACG